MQLRLREAQHLNEVAFSRGWESRRSQRELLLDPDVSFGSNPLKAARSTDRIFLERASTRGDFWCRSRR